MSASSIEWTDRTWNPVRGCTRVSEGCRNCYAERIAGRFSGPGQRFEGFARRASFTHGVERGTHPGRWTGKVELIPDKLDEPLRWRKPQRIFVNSMSDLFHEALPDEAIAAVFGIMAAAPRHTFQILTKRPQRMLDWLRWVDSRPGLAGCGGGFEHPFTTIAWAATLNGVPGITVRSLYDLHGGGPAPWPLPNVWLGVSVEDQATADERIPLLLQTPAEVRFISAEPLLEEVNMHLGRDTLDRFSAAPPIDQVIVGGESGPGARPFHAEWARSLKRQCRESMTAFFMKQMGANLRERNDRLATDRPAPSRELWPEPECGWHDGNVEHNPDGYREEYQGAPVRIRLKDRKGGDPSEWPEDLRVREFPA